MSALTLKAAADLFGVSVRTVRREIADGRLVAYRVRRALRIDAAEVARYRSTLRGREEEPGLGRVRVRRSPL